MASRNTQKTEPEKVESEPSTSAQEPPSVVSELIKKSKKKDDKYRKRDPKSWENVKKALNEMPNIEDRLKSLNERYSEVYNEFRHTNLELHCTQKALTNLQKEKERQQAELTRATIAKDHLENLCREIQKQNKALKEEHLQKLKDEEDKRREVANNFTERLNGLTTLINESKDKSTKVQQENRNMTQTLAELRQQYNDREQQVEHMGRQVDLQKQLYDTTVKQHEMILQAERSQYEQEKKCFLYEIAKKDNQIRLLEQNNKGFQEQIDVYKEQYTEFESTMSKSTRVFDNFKDEMSRMKRDLRLTERDRDHWKSKWQTTASHLIQFSETYSEMRNELSGAEKRLVAMQKLCRTLSAERSTYLNQLKENNIEPLPPPVVDNPELDQVEMQKSSQTQLKETVMLRRELKKMKEELREMGRVDTIAKEKLIKKEEALLNLKEDLAKLRLQENSSKEDIGESSQSTSTSSVASKMKRPRKAKAKGKGEANLPMASASNGVPPASNTGSLASAEPSSSNSTADEDSAINGVGLEPSVPPPSVAEFSSTNSTAGEGTSLDGIALDQLSNVEGFSNEALIESLVCEDLLDDLDGLKTSAVNGTAPAQNGGSSEDPPKTESTSGILNFDSDGNPISGPKIKQNIDLNIGSD